MTEDISALNVNFVPVYDNVAGEEFLQSVVEAKSSNLEQEPLQCNLGRKRTCNAC